MDVDAIIAEATTVADPVKASTEAAPVQEVKEETTEAPKPDSELTPEQLTKREANRKSHQDSKLAKMRRENRELREAVQRFNTQTAAPPADKDVAPQEKDFTNYGDFIRAEARWAAKQEIKEGLATFDNKQAESNKTQVLNAQKTERINQVSTEAAEFAKANPEYVALYKDHAEYMEQLPDNIENALLDADNPNLALFALMREGNLEALENLSPNKIAMEIGKAELRGEHYLRANKATNAPTPMQGAKGTGTPTKSLESKSVEELMKQFNSR